MKTPLWSRITNPTPAAVEEVDQDSSTLTLKTLAEGGGGGTSEAWWGNVDSAPPKSPSKPES
ncbi:hypothetical protein GBA52_024260 [Prunus armeniaca]|nr:hypothetical protein GBA52_024260 [Prunus armeniaca]